MEWERNVREKPVTSVTFVMDELVLGFDPNCLPDQAAQGLLIWCARNPALRHDCGNVLRRSHIERRILYSDALGRNRLTGDMRDLSRIALLDGNFASIRGLQINGRNRSRDIKRNVVFLGQ